MIDYTTIENRLFHAAKRGEQAVQFTRGEVIDLLERLYSDHNARIDANERIDKLAAFKAYVHKRLDDAGVPVDPESSHKAEGCRIGGRLDVLIGERDEMRAATPSRKVKVQGTPPSPDRCCPKCGSIRIAIERRPNGDCHCNDCGHVWPNVRLISAERLAAQP